MTCGACRQGGWPRAWVFLTTVLPCLLCGTLRHRNSLIGMVEGPILFGAAGISLSRAVPWRPCFQTGTGLVRLQGQLSSTSRTRAGGSLLLPPGMSWY